MAPPDGNEGAQPSVTIEPDGGEEVSRFAGIIARSGATDFSDFQLTRGQEIEIDFESPHYLTGVMGWGLDTSAVVHVVGTSVSFVNGSAGSYIAYTAKIKGLRTGTATLSFINNGTVLYTATISVTSPVTGIALDNETLYVGIGQSTQLAAIISPADADDLRVTWSSSEDAVVSVDENGEVWGVSEGSATISAESVDGSFTASCVVYSGYLTDALQIVDGDIALNGTNISRKLSLSFEPANATYKTAWWTSSDRDVAVVDAFGVVTARGNGHATITAASMDTGAPDSIDVTVSGFVRPTGIALNKSEIVLTTESKFPSAQLTATITPANASDKRVTWSVANEDIARVDGNGVVTPVSIGTTMVAAATADGLRVASCPVRVIKGKYTLSFRDYGTQQGGGWITYGMGPEVTYFYGDPVVFPGPTYGYRIMQWYMNRDFYYGTADPVPAGFMPESDMTFYAAQAAIHPQSVKIQGVSDPWVISASSACLGIYWICSPGVIANGNYKITSSDPSVATPDMVAEWYDYYDSEGVSSTLWLLKDGEATISVVMQDGSVTDSITLNISGMGTSMVNVHTTSGQARLATPVLKSADATSDTSATFRWDAVDGADGYIVYVEQNSLNWVNQVATVAGGAATSCTYVSNSGPVTGYDTHPYVYSVCAYKNVKNGKVYSGRSNTLSPVVKVSGVRFNQPALAVGLGQTVKTLKATVTPANAAKPALNWTSNNPSVATVGADGSVKGVRQGTATVTAAATDGSGKSASLAVTVVPKGVTAIKLSKSGVTIGRKQAYPLSATVSPSNASSKNVRWVSSNESVATVSATGVVTGVQIGTAKISAISSSGLEAVCTVWVVKIDPSGIAISKTKASMLLGSSLSLTATVSPANAENRTVTWSSSDTAVATVDQSGKVTAQRLGTATIRAGSAANPNLKTADCKITVKPVLVSGIALSSTKASIIIAKGEAFGKQCTLSATVSPANATNNALTWSTSNAKVATVDQNGKVTSVGNGKATITAAAKDGSGKKATCTVTVAVVLSRIEISGSHEVAAGKSVTLKASVQPANAVNKKVVWSSSDTSVAKVSASGVVTAGKAAAGKQVTIIARAADGGGTVAEYDMAVKPPIQTITLSVPSRVIDLAVTPVLPLQLTAANTPLAASQAVSWSTSNSRIATVSPSGLVTGLTKGTVTITAKAVDGSGKKVSLTITVTTRVRRLTITGAGEIVAGKSVALRVAIEPSSAVNKKLIWSSSDPSAAKVSGSGVVTASKTAVGKQVTISARSTDGGAVVGTLSMLIKPPAP